MRRLWRWIKSKFHRHVPSKPVEYTPPPKPDTTVPSAGRTVSMAGIALIIKFEGFSAKPYLDCGGVPTIGYGTIKYANGRMVTMNDTPLTKEQAKEELMYEVNQKVKWLNNALDKYKFKATQYEFDALASFAYNVGIGRITNIHTSSVARALKSRDRVGVVRGMMRYTRAGGRTIRGLVRRRKAEVKMFKGE